MEYELLYNELYEKTQDYGRAQFVRLLTEKEREKRKLKQQLQQKEDIINKAKEYIKDNANIYTNIMGKEVGFFKRHNDGWTPIELLEILDNKGE